MYYTNIEIMPWILDALDDVFYNMAIDYKKRRKPQLLSAVFWYTWHIFHFF